MGFLFQQHRDMAAQAELSDQFSVPKRDARPVYNDTSRPENRLVNPYQAFKAFARSMKEAADEVLGVKPKTGEEIQRDYEEMFQ